MYTQKKTISLKRYSLTNVLGREITLYDPGKEIPFVDNPNLTIEENLSNHFLKFERCPNFYEEEDDDEDIKFCKQKSRHFEIDELISSHYKYRLTATKTTIKEDQKTYFSAKKLIVNSEEIQLTNEYIGKGFSKVVFRAYSSEYSGPLAYFQTNNLTEMLPQCATAISGTIGIYKPLELPNIYYISKEGLPITTVSKILADQHATKEFSLFILEILHKAAQKLKVLHEHNFLHLDIKPDNIAYLPYEDDVIILDCLGIYTKNDFERKGVMDFAKTIGFASTEVLHKSKWTMISEKSDIFSWGASLFDLGAYFDPDLPPIVMDLLNEITDLSTETLIKDRGTFETILPKLEQAITYLENISLAESKQRLKEHLLMQAEESRSELLKYEIIYETL